MVTNMEIILKHLDDQRNTIVNSINTETYNRKMLGNRYQLSIREIDIKLHDLQESLKSLDKALDKLTKGN